MDIQARYKSFFDTLSGEYIKSAGISRKRLRAYMSRPDFFAGFNRIQSESRVHVGDVLALCEPVMAAFSDAPEEGWLRYVYERLCAGLFPYPGMPRPDKGQKQAIGFFLAVFSWFLDQETACPFDPLSSVYGATEEEQAQSLIREQYALFQQKIKEVHFRELLRIGRDVMPFDPASHTIGVHHVAVHTARQAALAGLPVDVPMVSAASLAHDIGKFGCRGEDALRIPYLHYYFTWQWLNENGMPDIAHVAANHSTWDLEFENLPLESLLLIYADFRVRGERDEHNIEHVRIYTLEEAYGVIFGKLADMTAEKQARYRTVYCKLRDLEGYLQKKGVNTDPMQDEPLPVRHTDAALLSPAEAVDAVRSMVFSNNVRLMRTITESTSFEQLLEQARDEKNLQRIRTYLRLFEEYSVYMTQTHKLLTLKFLYELLMHHEGDVRRHAGRIMGAILANSGPRYRKELPHAADPGAIAPTLNALLKESAALWDEYAELCLHPDHKISAKHALRISNSLKTVAGSLFDHCPEAEYAQYWKPLYTRLIACAPADRFVLMDTLLHVPLSAVSEAERRAVLPVLYAALGAEEARLRICALRALERLAVSPAMAEKLLQGAILPPDAGFAATYLYNRIRRLAALPLLPLPPFTVSEVYLANLKTSVHWTVKYAHIDWLCEHVRACPGDAFHVAMHLSNLLSVSEHLPVRERAGAALLAISPMLSVDQCNEIMVDLMRELETGQSEISSYIPPYLGRLLCRMPPKEFDEGVDFLEGLLRGSAVRSARAALETLGAILSVYTADTPARQDAVTERLTGLLLTGISHFENAIHITALEVLCRAYFSDAETPLYLRRAAFIRTGKKLLTLLEEPRESRLVFFNRAAMLNHLYRFLVQCETTGGLTFPQPLPVAFFPGTFDPFSAGHKRIVEEIRAHGFEVYLAVDEFSWSKRTLPKLLRRQIVTMSVAHLCGVYLFPDDIPVNIAVPEELSRLRALFAGRELYLVAGSDVIQNASAYRSEEPGSAAAYDHILFSRVDVGQPENPRRAEDILRGKILSLTLPAYYESASSTRIRENIDKDLDIAMLVDPVVQEFIYARGLYLRAPQYKRELRPYSRRILTEVRGGAYATRCADDEKSRVRGRSMGVTELYAALGSRRAAEHVRLHTSGRILLIEEVSGEPETLRMLCNDLLARSLEGDHTYAVCADPAENREMLEEMGFLPVPGEEDVMVTDMRSPLVLIEDALQRIKEPLKSDPAVVAAVRASRPAMRRAIAALFPGKLLLSLDAELLNAALLEKVQDCNGVLDVPIGEKRLGKCMCVPYGKILSDAIVPNTVTKALHADKVFNPDVTGFTITEYPDYSLLQNQIKTLKSFRRPVLLVDDLLHNGYRLEKLDPLFKEEGVEVERIIVGVLSGRGRDLMQAQGRRAECEYFIPNLLYWFTESLLYPFIGGDSVAGRSRARSFLPSVNLLLPYEYPKYLHGVKDGAIRAFSKAALCNAISILETLEARYQAVFSAGLTLKRLGEALQRPRLPDKGAHLSYDINAPASAYLRDDLLLLERISILCESEPRF